MEPETAKTLVVAITAVGSVAWMTSLVMLLRAGRERREAVELAAERFEVEGDFAPGAIVGEAEIQGQPEDLSAKLAGLLARDGMGPFGPVKIVSQDRKEVAFEPAGSAMMGFRSGRLRLKSVGKKTRVSYAIEVARPWYLRIAWVFQAIGLVALVAAPTLALSLAIPSPNPNVRAQAVQIVQMVHFLWPPFLFAYLSRLPGRMIRGRMDSLVHNLPYT